MSEFKKEFTNVIPTILNKEEKAKRKGKKRKIMVEKNWKTYWGSSINVDKDILKYGIDKFKKEIIFLCFNKWELAYYEAKEQFTRDVLLDDNYYNGWIRLKLPKQRKKK